MIQPRVQLLAFPGCPNADAARAVLRNALETVGLPGHFDDINVHHPATPAELRNWASPTILVNGQDVAGGETQEGTGCRVHPPDLATVMAALKAAMGSGRE